MTQSVSMPRAPRAAAPPRTCAQCALTCYSGIDARNGPRMGAQRALKTIYRWTGIYAAGM